MEDGSLIVLDLWQQALICALLERFPEDWPEARTTSAGTPAIGKILQVKHVLMATAPAAATLDTLPYSEFENWQDVSGSATELSIDRTALDVGSFAATILDASLDPATANIIRPGQAVRVRVNTPDANGNSVWENPYRGSLLDAQVTYVQNKGTVSDKDCKIVLSATDNITKLSQATEPRGVALITELPEILEGKNVPYEINGSSGQTATVQVVAVNENTSVLDQIAITRDTNAGYAYVNRHNVFIARDTQHMPTVPVGLIDETAYSGVDATFSVSDCMNAVTIKWLRYDSVAGETEEIVYGPYDDLASQAERGYHPAEFTMQGAVENRTAIAAKAALILATNAVPTKRINSVELPIRNLEDLHAGKALLDLYDLVTLSYARTGTLALARVTGVSHKISPKGWRMRLDFSPDGAVASPQLVPSPNPVSAVPTVAATPFGDRRASAAQSIATATVATITSMDTSDGLSGGMTFNGSAFTVPKAGLYLVTGRLGWTANATGVRLYYLLKTV